MKGGTIRKGLSLFEALGRFVYRRKKLIIAAWLLVAAASLPGALSARSVMKVGGFTNENVEAAQVSRALERELGAAPIAAVINFHSDTLTADDPEFERQVRLALSRIEQMPQVTGVSYHMYSPEQVSRDRHTVFEVVGLGVPAEESQNLVPELHRRLVPTSLQAVIGGGPVFYADIERTSQSDLQRAEAVAFPFALTALLLVFGSVVSAAVPLAVGGFSVLAVLALLAGVGHLTDLSIFSLNVATMLGLGLAVDYSLFLTSRFREELPGRGTEDALVSTVGTAGKAVFFSGLTVLIGLASLLSFDFVFLRSVGIAGVIVVFVSVLAALTLLPAILGVAGQRIDRLRVARPSFRGRRFWAPLAHAVMRRPVPVFLGTLLVLVLFGVPFLNVRLSSPDPTILPRGLDSRTAFDQVRSEFPPGTIAPILVLLRSDAPITSPRNLEVVYALSRSVAREPGVIRVDSLVDLDPRLTLDQYKLMYSQGSGGPQDPFTAAVLTATTREKLTVLQVRTDYSWNDPRSQRIVERLRSTRLPAGMTMQVGGPTADVLDVVNELYREFPRTALLVALATYVVLLFMLRSVLLPVKAILMNLLSILASYGALVWVFQEGHLSRLLAFQPMGFVEASLPILMFCTLFGLSMDYEVFLLSRIREEWEATHDNAASVAAGLERSGRIITSAALIVVVVGMAFVTAQIVLIKALGMGVALAVLLDATLVRALLVPAAMRLLGDWNWWLPGKAEAREPQAAEVTRAR